MLIMDDEPGIRNGIGAAAGGAAIVVARILHRCSRQSDYAYIKERERARATGTSIGYILF